MVVHPSHVWEGMEDDNECNEQAMFSWSFTHSCSSIQALQLALSSYHRQDTSFLGKGRDLESVGKAELALGGTRWGISPWCCQLCARSKFSLFVRTAPSVFIVLGRSKSPFQGCLLFYLIIRVRKQITRTQHMGNKRI